MQKGIAKSAAYSHEAAKNCGNAYSVHLWMFVEKGFIPPNDAAWVGFYSASRQVSPAEFLTVEKRSAPHL